MTKIREITFADHAGIVALLGRHGLDAKPLEQWRHLWDANPVLQGKGKYWPMGWVLEGDRGEIAAFTGNIPAEYELRGRKLRAAIVSGWAADAVHRGRAALLFAKQFSQKDADLVLSTTARASSAVVLEALKAAKPPIPDHDVARFAVTGYSGFAASFLAKKGVPLPKLAGAVAGFALQAADTLMGRRGGSRPRGAKSVRVLREFDAGFDRFWERLRAARADTLLAVRDRATLDWHYRFALAAGRAWVLTLGSGSELSAYAVLYRQDNPALGLTRIRLADLQTLPGDANAAPALLEAALAFSREQSVSMLEVIGLRREALDGFALRERKLEAWPFYFKTGSKELAAELADPRVWAPTLYDGDATL